MGGHVSPMLKFPSTSLLVPSLSVVPAHQPSDPCHLHHTRTGDLLHIQQITYFNGNLSNHPTLTFSHGVQNSVSYICVSFAVFLSDLFISLCIIGSRSTVRNNIQDMTVSFNLLFMVDLLEKKMATHSSILA